jgi:hypothetical protein
MRATCRKFVEAAGLYGRNFSSSQPYEAGLFGLALGDLRTSVGIQVYLIAEAYKLTIDAELATILPPQDIDDDPSWLIGFGGDE